MSNNEPTMKAVMTPLGQRLSAVWLSYWTRPLVWIMTLVYIVAVSVVLYWLHDPRPSFEYLESIATTDQSRMELSVQRSQWDVQRRMHVTPRYPEASPRLRFGPAGFPPPKHRGKVVQPEDAKTIEIYSENSIPADFWEPGRYPQVEVVLCYGNDMSSDTLTRLIQTYRLKVLVVNLSKDWTAATFETLAQADSLEYLSIDFSKTLMDPAALSWPKNLRQLQVHLYNHIPLVRFQEWRQLPRLDVLSLRVSPEAMDKFLAPEIVAELEQFPRRPTLYLDTPQGTFGEPAVAAQSHFRRLAVRPCAIPKARITSAYYGFLLLLIPTALALYHLSIQSMQPWMLLAPGATAPHQNFAARLFVLGSVVSAGIAFAYGSHWTAALAIGVTGVLWYQCQASLLQRGKGFNQVGFAHPFLAAFPLMFLGVFFIIGLIMVSSFPAVVGEIDWFLRGQRPWLGLGVFAVGIFAGRNLLKQVVIVQRAAQEAGYGQVPMSATDLAGWTRTIEQLTGSKYERQLQWNPVMRRRELRIETVLNRGPALTRRQRISLWMCGLHAHPADISLAVVIMGLVQFAFFYIGRFEFDAQLNRITLLIPAMQILVMFLMFPIGALWARRRWMAHELLFPISRREWMRDWFVMQACLMWPIFVVLGLLAVFDTLLGGILRPTAFELACGAAVLTVGLVTAWALSLIVATFRTSWITVVWVGVVMLFSATTAMAVAGSLFPGIPVAFEHFVTHPAAPYITTGGVVLLLAALVAWACHRWNAWEVGRIN